MKIVDGEKEMKSSDIANVKILIAMHKPYDIPDREPYFPLFCGKSTNNNFDMKCVGDDTGDNISNKNPFYCELTGLYWAWKNLSCDIIGLCHYRRYFAKNICGLRQILSTKDFLESMREADILLPRQEVFDKTIYEQYAESHCEADLQFVRSFLWHHDIESAKVFDVIMDTKALYTYNMFCMRRDKFDAYCKWLFPILESLV